MTTVTKRTVLDNIFATIRESTDEDEIVALLTLFDNMDSESVPIEELTELVLIPVNDTAHLWLAVNNYSKAFDAFYELLAEDCERIPSQPVYHMLEQAIAWADEPGEDDESEIATNLEWTTRLALLVHSEAHTFPAEAVNRLTTHAMWQARQCAVAVLTEIDREQEVVEFLHDDDPDVASDAIRALTWTPDHRDLLIALLDEEDVYEQVRKVAAKYCEDMTAHIAQ